MFAEELGGNASKRRQEENKARRRRLKQEQLKKEKQQQQKDQPAPPPLQSNPSSAYAPHVPAKAPGTSHAVDILPTVKSVVQESNLSAVQIANIQRQQRHEAQSRKIASIKIQSFYRMHRSNILTFQEQITLLSKRLQDLSTLRLLLKKQGGHDYVPPPATATSLCRQILFLTSSIKFKRQDGDEHAIALSHIKIRNTARDSKLIQQVFDLILIPGVKSTDENVNPFFVWVQSREGERRMQSVLRLALVTATHPSPTMDESVVRSCLAFVQAVTSSSKKEGVAVQVMQTCRAMLLAADLLPTALSSAVDIPMSISVDSDKADTSPRKTKSIGSQKLPYYALKNSPLDLISILRYHLLYVTGGAPIPSTSNSVREACIPAKQQKQASELFQTVFSILTQHQERQQIWERLVSEILTVPLLTWKVSNSALSLLLSCSRQNKLRRSQPLLVSLLEVFVDVHWDVINNGQIESLLCQDISLSKCNATPSQALLANLTQLGQSSVQLNASHPFKMDFDASIVYFRFIGSLVDAVPVSTLSSRESVVEWIDDGRGHHSPVVLSPVILEQCRMLVMDSWIRKLFNCAIDIEYLETESILSEKTDKDLKLAKEMADVAASSAAFLAAKEARVDRNKAFWKSAGWARKISKGMSTVLSKGNKTESDKTEKSGLINATALSRKLAAKGGDDNGGIVSRMESSLDRVKTESARSESYSPELLKVLCIVYGIVLSRWGGGGGEDIVRPKRITTRNEAGRNVVATSTPDPWTQSFLSVVCFSSPFIRVSWALIQGEKALSPNHEKAPVKSLSIRPRHNDTSTGSQSSNGPAIFYLFIAALSHVLILTDDVEIHDLGRPIPIHQLRRVIIALKNLLYKASCIDEGSTWSLEESKPSPCEESNYFGLALIQASSKTMRDLYDRSSRRPICVPKLWTIDDLMEKEFRKCKTKDDYVALLNAPVLRVCPFLVSFKRRLRLFERIVYTDRVQMQGENNANPFNPNPLKPGIPVRITRGRILEDGLATMNNLGSNMRQRIAIQYYNEAGAKETGIDAGGLFKEFWTDLSAIAFDLNFALFCINEENCMYPNPSSGAAHGPDHIVLFEFLGRILGKSLYENITIQPQFAHFFLSFLRGDYNYLHMFADLSTMDSQLYNNLMFLKTYDGKAEDLCLTFTVAVDDFGGHKEIPLIARGASTEVTNANKLRYIGLVTKYYVIDRVKEQSEAFTRGLWEVIDRSWLRIFNEPELQVLISGASDGKIDVDDLRAHTRYAGGFTGIDRTVSRFWNVLASLDSKQQADLLRFVTSCERPPPLGFATLSPPFTIQRVGIMRDGDKLPSSSTCFNVLKLPTYSSEKVMKERLLYAIQSGAGFELT